MRFSISVRDKESARAFVKEILDKPDEFKDPIFGLPKICGVWRYDDLMGGDRYFIEFEGSPLLALRLKIMNDWIWKSNTVLLRWVFTKTEG